MSVLDVRTLKTSSTRTFWVGYALILSLSAALRLIRLGSDPGYEMDEVVYTSVSRHLLAGDGLIETGEYPKTLAQTSNYLSHPPFHFLLQALWFDLTSPSLASARALAALCSLAALAIMGLAVRTQFGPRAALFAMTALGSTSWLIFQNRIAWIDNSQMLLVALLFAAIWRAERVLSLRSWLVVGALLGAVIVWKHTGGAFAVGTGITLVLLRPRIPQWGRAVVAVAGTTALVLAAYFVAMTHIFGQRYLGQSLHQFSRSTGETSSPGTMSFSTEQVRGMVLSPYWIFVGTGVLVIAAGLLMAAQIYRVLRVRWAVRRAGPYAIFEASNTWLGTELLIGMSIGSGLTLTVLQLRFPHYFIMLFYPALAYLGVQLSRIRLKELAPRSRRVLVAVLAATLVLNIGGGIVRLAWSPDNAVQSAASWLNTHGSHQDVLVGEEALGQLVDFPYCRSIAATATCAGQARWAETYLSYTQELPPNEHFRSLIARGTACVHYTGFRETITIYAIAPQVCPS